MREVDTGICNANKKYWRSKSGHARYFCRFHYSAFALKCDNELEDGLKMVRNRKLTVYGHVNRLTCQLGKGVRHWSV